MQKIIIAAMLLTGCTQMSPVTVNMVKYAVLECQNNGNLHSIETNWRNNEKTAVKITCTNAMSKWVWWNRTTDAPETEKRSRES